MAVKFDPNIHKVVSVNPKNNLKEQKEIKMFEQQSSSYLVEQETVCDTNKTLIEKLRPLFIKYKLDFNEVSVNKILSRFNISPKKLCEDNFDKVIEYLNDEFEKHYNKTTETLDFDSALKTAKQNLTISESNESPEDLKNKPKDIASVVNTQYAKTHNGEKVNFNKLSVEEKKAYIKEYFESKLQEYIAKPNMDEIKAQQLLLVDFEILVSNTPDDEKHLLLETAAEVFKSPDAVKLLFDSFDDKNKDKAMQLADSVSLDYLKDKGLISKEIVKHMSAEKAIEYLQTHDNEFKEFYASNKEIVDRVIDKVQKGEELSEEEQGIKAKLDSYEELRNILITGARENVYMSQDDKKKIEYKIKEIEDKQPSKLREYKQFYEAEKSAKEKSATDESGKFKTVPVEVIAKSEEKIRTIKQSLEASSTTEQSDTVESPDAAIVKDDTKHTSKATTGTTSHFDNFSSDFEAVKNFLTGKTEGSVSNSDKREALDKYADMDFNEQLLILKSFIKGEYLRECFKEAGYFALQKWHELNLTANCSYNTEYANQIYEEKREQRNLPS